VVLGDDLLVAASSYTPALFGLLGSLVGGAIAGTVSLVVARQARDAAEQSWIRDNRREIYDRLLTDAQRLLVACEESKVSGSEAAVATAQDAYAKFFDVYGVVQTVADRPVVDAVRVYAYRLLELKAELDGKGVLGPQSFHEVAALVRLARHDTIDAMRSDLGLIGSAKPEEFFNPFLSTEFAAEYHRRRYPSHPDADPGTKRVREDSNL
jgi:hypothetical protein